MLSILSCWASMPVAAVNKALIIRTSRGCGSRFGPWARTSDLRDLDHCPRIDLVVVLQGPVIGLIEPAHGNQLGHAARGLDIGALQSSLQNAGFLGSLGPYLLIGEDEAIGPDFEQWGMLPGEIGQLEHVGGLAVLQHLPVLREDEIGIRDPDLSAPAEYRMPLPGHQHAFGVQGETAVPGVLDLVSYFHLEETSSLKRQIGLYVGGLDRARGVIRVFGDE